MRLDQAVGLNPPYNPPAHFLLMQQIRLRPTTRWELLVRRLLAWLQLISGQRAVPMTPRTSSTTTRSRTPHNARRNATARALQRICFQWQKLWNAVSGNLRWNRLTRHMLWSWRQAARSILAYVRVPTQARRWTHLLIHLLQEDNQDRLGQLAWYLLDNTECPFPQPAATMQSKPKARFRRVYTSPLCQHPNTETKYNSLPLTFLPKGGDYHHQHQFQAYN